MRILELFLTAFPPFQDVSLDLSGGHKGLHLIYGPNEAGKTSTLAALKHLFYGFPVQMGEFYRPYKALRLGARIRNDAGKELHLIRRKANMQTLRAADDATPLDDDALKGFLDNVDQNLFERFFGIDHAMLVEGGRSIVEGEGDIGKILFSGSGVADLHQVQKTLQQESEQLYLPHTRAFKPNINSLLKEYDETRKLIREHQLPDSEWEAHDQALQRAIQRRRRVEAELQEQTRERTRLDRLRKALPLIAERANRLAAREEVKDAILLPPDFPKHRAEIEQQLRLAETHRQLAEMAIRKRNEEIAELNVPQPLLDQQDVIQDLYSRLGAHRKAMIDLPGLEAQYRAVHDSARVDLRRLGQDLELDQAPKLQLPEVERKRIGRLGRQYEALVKHVETWKSKLSEIERQLDQTQAALEQLPPPRDGSALQTALLATHKLGDIEAQLLTARREAIAAEKQLQLHLGRLPLWSGSAAQLETLRVPAVETIERFQRQFDESDAEMLDLNRQLERQRQEADDLDRDLNQLQLAQDVPTEEGLREVRARRDELWRELRDSLASGGRQPPDLLQFENALRHADDLADRLRREAERVARFAELQARRRKADEQITRLERKHADADATRRQLIEEWTRGWEPAGFAPLSPREMLAWIRQQRELTEQIQTARQLREQAEDLRTRVEEARQRLREQLIQTGEQPPPADASLTQLVALAEKVLATLTEALKARDQAQRDLNKLTGDQYAAVEQHKKAVAQLEAWQSEWRRSLERLPVSADADPEEADRVLNTIEQIAKHFEKATDLKGRIDGIHADAARFRTDVESVVTRVAPDLSRVPFDQATVELNTQLTQALNAARTQERLVAERTEEQVKLEAAQRTVAEMQSQLAALCAEARCQTPQELPQAEERSQRRRQIEAELADLEQRLLELSAGASLEEFVEQSHAIDGDSLPMQIGQLETRIAELDAEKSQLSEEIGREDATLKTMDSSALAADAAERSRDILLRLTKGVEEYARLKLALVVLSQGIERYRKQHQGPILQRASDLFARLTVGSFVGVRVVADNNSKPYLVGVRANGDEIGVTEMSDGTADQLYLAVRLAWLETWLEKHESMPLIVDDILIRFDDRRSLETLRVLADLSQRTQVLFFTHHRHLLELGREHLSSEVFFAHELPTDRGPAVPVLAATAMEPEERPKATRKRAAKRPAENLFEAE